MSSSTQSVGGPGRGTLFAMALAAGLAVASIYYNQPMLGVMSGAFHDARVGGWIPTLTQLGYAAGLLFLLPLGDMLERRRLIVVQFGVLALALVIMALAPGLAVLAIASVLVGAAATVAQQIVPFAAILSAPEKRGAAIGTVMSGLLTGILLSRTLAGLVSSLAGWRAMFWLAVPLAVLGAVLMARTLPAHHPVRKVRYRELFGSLVHLWRHEPVLRRAAFTQALLFASFSAFWTTLALRLAQPPLHLGAASAGLFGIVGAVGVAMAPVAGRMADRRGPAPVIALGAASTIVAWLVFGFWQGIAGLVVGVIVLDFGVQISLVSNQHLIYGLHPEYKSRLNTLFMTTMFVGGALGSLAASTAWGHGGWAAVCVLGGVLPVGALLLNVARRPSPHSLNRIDGNSP
ncbi:Predicted arabinose efflux permease, MFS family [Luteibacter sp. UNC138MFCol5.1]|uniref:MFS transporter n=1 Tax=Luteibacter sp. UNC138MFCol5.1 TaxID=1502774 RepID=UPI0008AAA4C7|nr:MFS transporter [Luteibacter sp. UNC138MFCol5.1]SEO89910.1 Predicted arabinose efflux permease, MFS family [Luteibacter sp. UNC138MFCol5.1]